MKNKVKLLSMFLTLLFVFALFLPDVKVWAVYSHVATDDYCIYCNQKINIQRREDGNLYFCVNDKICIGNPGLIEYNGFYYEVKWSGKVAVSEKRNLTAEKIGELDVEPGIYYFDEEGKLEVPFTGVKADGNGVLYYYVNGEICVGNPGLIEYDSFYYEVKWSDKVAVSEKRNLTAEKIGELDVEPGIYYFDEEGKLEVPFTGVKADGNGVLYYYVNGEICVGNPGLIEYDGAFYYAKWSGKIAVNESRNLTAEQTNGYVKNGKYFFDWEGKMILPKKMLTIIDDDGYEKFYDLIFPIIQEKQVSISSAVPTSYINGEVSAVADRVMSWEQIWECYMNGAEILSHTHMHATSAKVDNMTYSEILDDYMKSYQILESHYIISDGLVFAGGSAANPDCQSAAKEIFSYAFKSAGDKINRYGEFDPYKINRYGIYSEDYDDLKTLIDELNNESTGWMVWMIHTSDGEFGQQEAALLSQAIDYALSNGIEIVSSSEGYKMYSLK